MEGQRVQQEEEMRRLSRGTHCWTAYYIFSLPIVGVAAGSFFMIIGRGFSGRTRFPEVLYLPCLLVFAAAFLVQPIVSRWLKGGWHYLPGGVQLAMLLSLAGMPFVDAGWSWDAAILALAFLIVAAYLAMGMICNPQFHVPERKKGEGK